MCVATTVTTIRCGTWRSHRTSTEMILAMLIVMVQSEKKKKNAFLYSAFHTKWSNQPTTFKIQLSSLIIFELSQPCFLNTRQGSTFNVLIGLLSFWVPSPWSNATNLFRFASRVKLNPVRRGSSNWMRSEHGSFRRRSKECHKKCKRQSPLSRTRRKVPEKWTKLQLMMISTILFLIGAVLDYGYHSSRAMRSNPWFPNDVDNEVTTVNIPKMFRLNGNKGRRRLLDDSLTNSEIDEILLSFHAPFFDEHGNQCDAGSCPYDTSIENMWSLFQGIESLDLLLRIYDRLNLMRDALEQQEALYSQTTYWMDGHIQGPLPREKVIAFGHVDDPDFREMGTRITLPLYIWLSFCKVFMRLLMQWTIPHAPL